ncbi:MAG: 30S ribosome-binding factor RbfA [Candidatus Paceibacterota bacterium]
MAEQRRQEQIAEAIRNQAGRFFTTEQPTGTLITVTEVSMSSDLHYAEIYLSILPTDKKEFAMKKAQESLPGLRRQIGNNLKLRRVPELRLDYDNRYEARQRVEKVLEEEVRAEELSHSRLKRILDKLAWWRR